MTVALRPTRKGYNPRTREGFYADPDQVAYVLRMVRTQLRDGSPTGLYRVATSSGSVGWELGRRVEIHHDQTMRRLGEFRVVGISYPEGLAEGEVPNRKLSHWVFK